MDGGAWWATVHGVAKNRTRLSDFPFTFHFHALEKETASHSSILAWESHRQRSPAAYSAWGGRVRQDLATAQQPFVKSLSMFMFFDPEIARLGIYLITSLFQDSPAAGSVGLFSSGSPFLSPFLVFFKALPPAEVTGWNCQRR